MPPISATSPDRRDWIDAARGVALVLVIVGHAMEPMFYHRPDNGFSSLAFTVWRFVYSAHVPALFMIAGLVRRPYAPQQAGKTRSPMLLICLAIVWHIIGAAVMTASAVVQSPSLQTLSNALVMALRPLILGTGFSLAPLWFLLTLGCVEMIWARLRAQPAALAATAIGLTVIAVIAPQGMANFWGFKTLGPALCFYALGDAARGVPRRWFVWSVGVTLVICLAATAANRGCQLPGATWCPIEGFHGRFGVFMAIGRYGVFPLFLLAASAGSLAILGLGGILAASPFAGFWTWAGRRSLDLYLVNALMLTICNPILRLSPLSGDDVPLVPLVAAVAVISQALIARLAGPSIDRTKFLAAHLATKLASPIKGASR